MKVKIKKEGKVKQFKLISKWSDVTLEKWLKLIEFSSKNKAKEAKETIAALSDIPKKLIKILIVKPLRFLVQVLEKISFSISNLLQRITSILRGLE